MSKARRRPAARKSSSASKRKTTRRRTSSSKKPTVIRLKPLYDQIGRVLKQLEQLQQKRGPAAAVGLTAAAGVEAPDSVSRAIARLTQHRADFDDICGPSMQVPAP